MSSVRICPDKDGPCYVTPHRCPGCTVPVMQWVNPAPHAAAGAFVTPGVTMQITSQWSPIRTFLHEIAIGAYTPEEARARAVELLKDRAL